MCYDTAPIPHFNSIQLTTFEKGPTPASPSKKGATPTSPFEKGESRAIFQKQQIAYQLFGADMDGLIEEMNEELAS
jgi:hypothetical protein